MSRCSNICDLINLIVFLFSILEMCFTHFGNAVILWQRSKYLVIWEVTVFLIDLFLDSLQTCTDVLTALRKGDFGPCDTTVEDYISKCHTLFPYTALFNPLSNSTLSENNHVIASDQDNCHSNWCPMRVPSHGLVCGWNNGACCA